MTHTKNRKEPQKGEKHKNISDGLWIVYCDNYISSMNKNKIFRPIEEEEEITSNKFRKTKDKFIKEKESSDKMSVITAKGAQQVT